MLMTTQREEADQLQKMRVVSQIEGTTLIMLLFVAVPMKHLLGVSTATAIMGPIHGVAFVIYVWMLIQTVSSLDFTKAQTARMILAAFIPFGGFVNERALARREAILRKM
jgi:integral membrane protein